MLLWLQAGLVAVAATPFSGGREQCAKGKSCQTGGLTFYQHRSQYLKHSSGGFEQHAALGSQPECKDAKKCATGWKGKCSRWKVKKSCPQMCGICGKCADFHKNCPKWKTRCSKAGIKSKCPLTCGTCSSMPTPAPSATNPPTPAPPAPPTPAPNPPTPAPPVQPPPPWTGVRGRKPPLKLEKEYLEYPPRADDVTKHPECNNRGMWLVDTSVKQGLLLEVHGNKGCLAQKSVRPPFQSLASFGQVESESSKAWPGTPYSLTTNEDECQLFRRVAHSSNDSSLVMLRGMDSLGRKTGRDGHGGVGFLGHDPTAALSRARDFQRDCAGHRCLFREAHLPTGQRAFVQQNGGLILVTRHRGQAWAVTTEDISLHRASHKCGVSGYDFGGETTPERCAMLVSAASACGKYFMWSGTAVHGGPSCICCSRGGQDNGARSNSYSVWKLNGGGDGGDGGDNNQPTTTSTTPNGVGFCSRCEWPWYGKFCQKRRSAPDSSVDVLVIVFQAISTDLQTRIDQYRADLATYERLSSAVLVWDLPKIPSLRPQRELRHLIKTDYVYRKIRAVFLVGDYPLAWAKFPGFRGRTQTGPILSYFSDFSGAQQFLPTSSETHLYSLVADKSRRHADIAIGIINHASEQELLDYFDRLHSHRATDGSLHPQQKQWSFNGGDWRCDSPYPIYHGGFGRGSHFCHEGKYKAYRCPQGVDCKAANREVYRSMLENPEVKYEYYNAKAHSWHYGFSFGVRLNDMIGKPFSGLRFFNLFHCSSAKTSERNLAYGMAIASKHGLASVGTTHTGAMLHNGQFEYYLQEGDSWGEALRRWWNFSGKKNYDNWHAGMTGYGDPMVRMRGGKIRQGEKPGSLTEESAKNDPQGEEEEISDAALRALEKAFDYDLELEDEHADEDVNFEDYEQLMTEMYGR